MIGRIAAARHQLRGSACRGLPWRLRRWPVCASTEIELERWLRAGAQPPLAVLSGQQRFGHGQQGRPWQAPPGGVWISAALPWPPQPHGTAALGLAVAVGLALQLEALGLKPRLKWPNDLLLDGAKVAGLLPRLRRRGERIRWAQVGLGLNGHNPVPAGATSVARALGRHRLDTAVLAARVLLALEWAAAQALAPERVRREAEARLLLPTLPVPFEGEWWQAHGLGSDGSLELALGPRRAQLRRLF
ncbi:biotin--[acetyl-CoA-carboxylase] ligase [Cyanobium sp. Morenito 9A2]|uniref:biotin--[acetyl-CoA-carboxylase] ligase n=1 Tax=Cyanobium sp. Morenito 9A2 TaxID=2823718 RepID=UPI0020CDE508|nr:biotin--[acetyl-CoA-carboxylase] ligase [Cyanobium sp. Morenito 9A2]MCP9848263.1 biotin--[acetyl-CoA-carboxylase] ligase [Cyanobium sp. Morenito 9A2]